MANRPEYAAALSETHHIHTLAAPSGTAVTLANQLIEESNRYNGWVLAPEKASPQQVSIEAIREGEVPGTHQIKWQSEVDEISIEHRAHSRTGFAAGAVLAATWLADKQGVFEMKDVLGL